MRDPRARLYPAPLQLSRSASLSFSLSQACTCFFSLPSRDAEKSVSIAPLPFTLAALQYHMGQRFRERGDCSVTLPINTEQLHWVLFCEPPECKKLTGVLQTATWYAYLYAHRYIGWTVSGAHELALPSALGKKSARPFAYVTAAPYTRIGKSECAPFEPIAAQQSEVTATDRARETGSPDKIDREF